MFRRVTKSLSKVGFLALTKEAIAREAKLFPEVMLFAMGRPSYKFSVAKQENKAPLKLQLENYLKVEQGSLEDIKNILVALQREKIPAEDKTDYENVKLFWRNIASDLPVIAQASDVLNIGRTALYLNVNDSFLWYNIANYAHVNFPHLDLPTKLRFFSILCQVQSRQIFYSQIAHSTLPPVVDEVNKIHNTLELQSLVSAAFVFLEQGLPFTTLLTSILSSLGEGPRLKESLKKYQQDGDFLAQLAYVLFWSQSSDLKVINTITEVVNSIISAQNEVHKEMLWNSISLLITISSNDKLYNETIMKKLVEIVDKKLKAGHSIDFENATIILSTLTKRPAPISGSTIVKALVDDVEKNATQSAFEIVPQLDGRNIVNFLMALGKFGEQGLVEQAKINDFYFFFQRILEQKFIETRVINADYVELVKLYSNRKGEKTDSKFLEWLKKKSSTKDVKPGEFPVEVYTWNEYGVFEKIHKIQ